MKLFTQISPWTTRTAQAAGPDEAYMKAVRDGDTETVQRMVDEAAKAAGYTVGPVVHGSRNPGITVFRTGRAGGIYFTDDRDYAAGHGPNLYHVMLKLDRMADLKDPRSETLATLIRDFNDTGGWSWNEDAMEGRKSPDFDPSTDETWEIFDAPNLNVARFLRDNKFDGTILEERKGAVDSYVVLDPRKVKSIAPVTLRDPNKTATPDNIIPLSERFNSSNPDIRY